MYTFTLDELKDFIMLINDDFSQAQGNLNTTVFNDWLILNIDQQLEDFDNLQNYLNEQACYQQEQQWREQGEDEERSLNHYNNGDHE